MGAWRRSKEVADLMGEMEASEGVILRDDRRGV